MARRKVMIAIDAQATDAIRKIKELGGEVVETGESARQASKGFDLFGTAITAAAVIQAGRAVYELGELGAQSLRTKDAFENISGGAEVAADNLEAMQRATRGAMSETELMGQASRLLQMGIANNSDELETMTTMAVRLGTAMGRDASASIEEFSLLLANQSIPRLDTFGISASNVRTRMKELRDANKDLTREQVFLQAVQEEGEKAMTRLGDRTDDVALSYEQVEAMAADFRTELGEKLAPTMNTVIRTALTLIGATDDLRDAFRGQSEDAALVEESYEDYRDRLERTAHSSGLFVDQMGRLHLSATKVIDDNYIMSESAWAAAKAYQGVTSEAERYIGYVPRLTTGIEDVAASADTATPAIERLAGMGGKLAREFGEFKFDAKSIWQMALASGATLPQLAEMARTLGIASDEEIEHTLRGHELIQMWQEGEIAARDVQVGFRDMTTEVLAGRQAAAEATGEIEYLRGGMVKAHEASDAMRPSIHQSSEKLRGMAGYAKKLGDNLRKIPKNVYVDVFIETHGQTTVGTGTQERQFGGPVVAGRPYIVGEAGPELFVPPTSGRIVPNADRGRSVTWTGNIIIQGATDPNATAEQVMRRLQDRGIVPRVGLM